MHKNYTYRHFIQILVFNCIFTWRMLEYKQSHLNCLWMLFIHIQTHLKKKALFWHFWIQIWLTNEKIMQWYLKVYLSIQRKFTLHTNLWWWTRENPSDVCHNWPDAVVRKCDVGGILSILKRFRRECEIFVSFLTSIFSLLVCRLK